MMQLGLRFWPRDFNLFFYIPGEDYSHSENMLFVVVVLFSINGPLAKRGLMCGINQCFQLYNKLFVLQIKIFYSEGQQKANYIYRSILNLPKYCQLPQ